ncbi:MAG: hypothetical protein GYB65_03655, partial [Chloroflexi bacterium]|nr:hypothetical protein [Chloroflexota bacterium]
LVIPSTAVGTLFVANADVFWAPDADAQTDVVIPAGNTARAIGLDESGAYYKVLWECQFLWVPAETLAPNPDAVWNGAPLPTDVVQ